MQPDQAPQAAIDPIELAVFQSATHSVAEEMGATLRRTSFSPNIKERRDYSCAVFDSDGQVIAMGDHMPVHLGSMPMSVRAAIDAMVLGPGDIAILNDPYAGGTHLPDIHDGAACLCTWPGLCIHCCTWPRARTMRMSAECTPAPWASAARSTRKDSAFRRSKSWRRGVINRSMLQLILHNVRTPAEREGDLMSQIGACRVRGGAESASSSRSMVRPWSAALSIALLDYSERLMRAGGSPACPRVGLSRRIFSIVTGSIRQTNPSGSAPPSRFDPAARHVLIDFAGSSARRSKAASTPSSAITYSAVYYVFRCLLPEDGPCHRRPQMRPITVLAPSGSIVNAIPPAPVAGGNVETSQRIVDSAASSPGTGAAQAHPRSQLRHDE